MYHSYLNIWQPANIHNIQRSHRQGLAPVLFWIYGGAFLQGGASKAEYVGNKLAERGVSEWSFIGLSLYTAGVLFHVE